MVSEGVRRAYNHPDNKLRASVLADPARQAPEHQDNTPAVVNTKVVPGATVDVIVATPGRRLGSQRPVRACSTRPIRSSTGCSRPLPTMGAGWCPPGMLRHRHRRHRRRRRCCWPRSADGADRHHELHARAWPTACRGAARNCAKVSARHRAPEPGRPDHGARRQGQGLPDHAANLPVRMIPNCAATRHAHFTLGGSGPVMLDPPRWPTGLS